MEYQVDETVIPITAYYGTTAALLDTGGDPRTGQNVRVNIFNDAGVRVVSAGTMTEVSFGMYRYAWTHGVTADSSFLVVVYAGTGASGPIIASWRIRIVTVKRALTNTVDLADGKIV